MSAKKPCLCTVSGYRISDGLKSSNLNPIFFKNATKFWCSIKRRPNTRVVMIECAWNHERIIQPYLWVTSVDFLVEFSVSLVDVSNVLVFIVHASSVEILSLCDLRLKSWKTYSRGRKYLDAINESGFRLVRVFYSSWKDRSSRQTGVEVVAVFLFFFFVLFHVDFEVWKTRFRLKSLLSQTIKMLETDVIR